MIDDKHWGDDDWAKVELFRWQHGHLPDANDGKKLDIPTALLAMAKAIEDGCKSGEREKMPNPFNVCSVLAFCARQLRK